jgi:hypothetical protein
MITAGNHPTANQMGTGDRLGLFRDRAGTIWGLPLAIMPDGSVVGCAPPAVRDAQVTDSYPAGATIIGATNEPTGWRGGTGKFGTPLARPTGKSPMASRERFPHRRGACLLGSGSTGT